MCSDLFAIGLKKNQQKKKPSLFFQELFTESFWRDQKWFFQPMKLKPLKKLLLEIKYRLYIYFFKATTKTYFNYSCQSNISHFYLKLLKNDVIIHFFFKKIKNDKTKQLK